MTKAIQILSKNLTGKENILIKETNSQSIKINFTIFMTTSINIFTNYEC